MTTLCNVPPTGCNLQLHLHVGTLGERSIRQVDAPCIWAEAGSAYSSICGILLGSFVLVLETLKGTETCR